MGGYVTGTVLLVVGAVAAMFGLDLLATCARDTRSRRTSYGVVAQASVPAATIVIDAAVAIKCFGMLTPHPRPCYMGIAFVMRGVRVVVVSSI